MKVPEQITDFSVILLCLFVNELSDIFQMQQFSPKQTEECPLKRLVHQAHSVIVKRNALALTHWNFEQSSQIKLVLFQQIYISDQ
jgi:hypothetical protein